MIPADIQRFIITSIESVPHLEAVLLLRSDPAKGWSVKQLVQTLYISEKRAEAVLADLAAAGFADAEGRPASSYRYRPVTAELQAMVDRVAEVYTTSLVEVTNLIHSKLSKQAQEFGDAFKWHD